MRTQFMSTMAICTFFASMVSASVLAADTAPPPAEVIHFLGPDDTLLAYRAGELFGAGLSGAVIIVRHPVPDEAYDFDKNPCELIVLKGEGRTLSKFATGTTVVDCVYNDLNKRLGSMALNDLVSIGSGSFSFINQKERGTDGFYFRYSVTRAQWYLERATATFMGAEGITSEEALYPRDFGWTSLSDVSPENVARALNKHKTVSK
ncbi:hypothetical protein [Dyella sp. 333MFSha]|uniref:hypothetical protein n=1 Tax=Dyella sp. 333MFSha TaxID=1798240 RepID=UPI000883D8CA|nr:hypothetical protein [Dyella sp. 333MFSha]SDF64991.1 hypothetical protein SAMN04515659_1460 [Dyella sp. 333MFSha]